MTTQDDLNDLNKNLAYAAAFVANAQADAKKLQADITAVGPTPPPGWTTLWLHDTFTTLDATKWNTFYGPGVRWDNMGALPAPYSGGNQPGANDAAQYDPNHVAVNSGLTLTATRGSAFANQGYTWTSGCLTTKNPLPTTGWYVRVRAKMPDQSQGMWPAHWFLPANDANEFDGYEGGWPKPDAAPGAPNTTMHSAYDSDASGWKQLAYGVPVDVTAGYNVYGYEYKPGVSVKCYFNDALVWQLANANVPIGTEAYYLFLQLQVAAAQTSGWHTVTNANTPTSSMEISEVQVWT